jgi:PTS system nitrogen regulatory IIA component
MKRAIVSLRRKSFLEVLQKPIVALDLDVSSKQEVLESLCALAEANSSDSKSSLLVKDVILREKLQSTAIGNTIAIPHGRASWCKNPQIVVATLARPIEWNAPDGQKVEWVFLIITSLAEDGSQVWLTRNLAAAMLEENTRTNLKKFNQANTFAQNLTEAFMKAPWAAS